MKKDTRLLYKALASLIECRFLLEDACQNIEDMSPEEIQKVVKKYSTEIGEFDTDVLRDHATYAEDSARSLLNEIDLKL